MKTKIFASLLVALFLSASCISEPLADGGGDGGDGTPTPVSLSICSDRFTGEKERQPETALRTPWAGDTRTVAEDETRITELHLLVFDAKGEAVTNERFTDLDPASGTYQLKAETMPGEGMQFYAIANADVAELFNEKLSEQLANVKKLSDWQGMQATLTTGNDGLSRTDRLLMVGSATVNVTKPHRTAIPLTLCFLPAKVTVKMIDATDDSRVIDITGWDMVNVPKKSYLAMREASDAVTGTNTNDYLTTHEKAPFEKIDTEAKTWSHTFYLFENRRGGRQQKAPSTPAEGYPGMGIGDGDQRGKAWYAPAGATYLLVYGTYEANGYKNNVVYRIYLGANNHSDYNVERGKHYTYTVTINGLNQIDIDTTVDWGAASFTVTQSDNWLMDAHPDVRVLRIGGTAVDASTPATATVEVLGEAKSWLAVSPLNLYRHAVKQAEQAGYEHQQFAASDGKNTFVRTKYTTVTATAAFGNATFGMTRQLTQIPFEQPAVSTYQDVMVYADNYTGTSDRTAKVLVTYYNGTTVVGQKNIDITQSGAFPVSADLFMERYEESAMKIHPALADELQRTIDMQWGYNSAFLCAADDRFSNGNYLTANAVYNTVTSRSGMTAPQWKADTYAAYRAKYPRKGNAVITEPSSMTTSGAPYYYPDLQVSTPVASYFHPIYNSSAARYCHEKNRDLDGDGIINANETVWYLPSYSDMVAIKKNPPEGLTGTYWTSTEESDTKSWAFTFPGGTAAAVDKTTVHRVRCVWGKGVAMTEPTFESGEEDKTKITLEGYTGDSGIIQITDDKNFGIEWTVTSNTPAWLQIATDAKGTAAEATKTATGNATLYAYARTANPSEEETRAATLTFTRSMSVNKTIEVTQELSPLEPSNCYMVPPGSAVNIPVERANESPLPIGDSTTQLQAATTWTASLVWESSPGLVTLSKATGTGPEGCFRVTATSTPIEGNAVVAIKNGSNEILWSWHIWVTVYNGTTTFTTNNGKRDVIFMDRAIGAASATATDGLKTCGLHYQWGRKDPFPGLGQQGGSWSAAGDPISVYNASGSAYQIPKIVIPVALNFTNATRNPGTYYYGVGPLYNWFCKADKDQNDDLWSGGNLKALTPAPKSVFDPCPTGWRVPVWIDNTSPFAGMTPFNSTWGNNGRTWLGTGGYFPASGFRNGDYGLFSDVNRIGYFWTGSPDILFAYRLAFDATTKFPLGYNGRGHAFPIRCCKDNL